MVPTNLLNTRGLVAISPGPLLGSTVALVLFWVMRHGRERRLTWTSTPLPPRGYQLLPTASTSQLVRVGMTAEQPQKSSQAFYEWVFAMTTRFYGKPWLLHRPGRSDVLVVSSPAAFEDIQRTFAVQFDKIDDAVEGFARDVHGGVIASVCTGQLRPSVNMQRQLAASVLGSQSLRLQASYLVKKHLPSLLKALEDAADAARLGVDSRGLEVEKLMQQFAMEVFTELGFGLQLGALLEKAVDDVHKLVAERSKRPAVSWKLERLLDVGSEAALSRSINVVNSITLGAVEAKKKKPRPDSGDTPLAGSRVDMLDILLGQKCSSKSSKDPEFLAEFVLGLVVAARDSMTHTLSNCLQCLAQNPEEQDKVVRELKEAEDEDRELQSVVRLEAVIKETLRLHPPKPFIRRRARQDTVLSDHTFVAAGTEVAMDLYSMARHENVWGVESAQFRPQRWIDTTNNKLRPVSNYKFNAFLGGPRACLGADIALSELKVVIAAVINKLHLESNAKDKTRTRDETCDEGARIQFGRRDLTRPGHYS